MRLQGHASDPVDSIVDNAFSADNVFTRLPRDLGTKDRRITLSKSERVFHVS